MRVAKHNFCRQSHDFLFFFFLLSESFGVFGHTLIACFRTCSRHKTTTVNSFSGTVSIISFGTTYAKQLGYSKVTVGYVMTCLFVLSMLTKPVVGAICDKFSIKRFMFLSFILLSGISSALFMLVPQRALETSAELHCDLTTAAIKIYSDDKKKLSVCDRKRLTRIHDDRLVDCKVFLLT